MTASKLFATALSFFKFNGVLRNMKSISSVVTGTPWSAAAALPTIIASRRCSANTFAIRIRSGSAFILLVVEILILEGPEEFLRAQNGDSSKGMQDQQIR